VSPAPSPAPAATGSEDAKKAEAASAGKGEKLAARTNDAAPSSVVKRSRRVRAQRQLRIDTSETEISHPTKTRDTNGR
jgi:hypothetical protein